MLVYHSDYTLPEAVRLSRPEWKSPLVLDFEGLTARLGSKQAERIWTALYVHGEYIDSAGTRYVRMIPVKDEQT